MLWDIVSISQTNKVDGENHIFFINYYFYFYTFKSSVTIIIYSGPHSLPVGGGNSPFRCLPNAKKTKKEEEDFYFEGCCGRKLFALS